MVNKTFVKIMEELGYDVELTYKKKVTDCGCGKSEFGEEVKLCDL